MRELYANKVKDPRFLIPVVNGLPRAEIVRLLPQFLALPGRGWSEVLLRLLGGDYGRSPISPAELLVALHQIDPVRDNLPMKTIMSGITTCLGRKDAYVVTGGRQCVPRGVGITSSAPGRCCLPCAASCALAGTGLPSTMGFVFVAMLFTLPLSPPLSFLYLSLPITHPPPRASRSLPRLLFLSVPAASPCRYKHDVLAVGLQQLLELSPLPTLLMRTVIQTLQLSPRLKGFVVREILTRLIKEVGRRDFVGVITTPIALSSRGPFLFTLQQAANSQNCPASLGLSSPRCLHDC